MSWDWKRKDPPADGGPYRFMCEKDGVKYELTERTDGYWDVNTNVKGARRVSKSKDYQVVIAAVMNSHDLLKDLAA